jgi:hypothetical protein
LASYSIISIFSGLLSPPVTLSPELMELLAELGRSIVKKRKSMKVSRRDESWNLDLGGWLGGWSK